MAWLPVKVDQLRIGLFIKVDHTWLEHPFVRNTFKITSPKEIVIIRQYGLTKIFHDPDRSDGNDLSSTDDSDTPPSARSDNELAPMVADDVEALRKEKSVHVQQVLDHHRVLTEAAVTYGHNAKRCADILAMTASGKREGLQQADHMAAAMVDLLEQQTVMLSLVHTETPTDPGQELAVQTMNLTALTMLTGKFMNLPPQHLKHLSLGSLFYKIGQGRVPPAILDKGPARSPAEAKVMQGYPQFGKDILESMPEVSPEVIDIVQQHREFLDGTGYPRGLINGAITQLARLVGTVAEYTELTKAGARSNPLNPTQALSHLYVHMKQKLGPDVIEAFIATMTVYPPGTYVEMSDRSIGKVVRINAAERMRPVVMLYDPESTHDEAAVIDLSRVQELSIQKSLNAQAIAQPVLDMLNPGRVEGYLLSPVLG